MDHFKPIKTKRLILRLFNKDDFEVFSNILNDNIVFENLKFILKREARIKPKFLFQSILNSYKIANPIVTLLIIKKDTENKIGLCGLIPLVDRDKALCFYSLLPMYRGNGFAIEAMKKVLEYGFLNLKFSKLITLIDPKSTEVWKVAERIGMKYMGQIQIDEIKSNAMYFSIKKAEFDGQQII